MRRLSCGAVRLLVAAAFMSATLLAASAHQAEPTDESSLIDCDHPPSGAVSAVPEPIAEWTRVVCWFTGYLIVQGDGWIWRYPGSWTDQVRIPAWLGSQDGTEARFFVSLSMREHDAASAARMDEAFARTLPTYRSQSKGTSAPVRAFTLSAQADSGNRFDVSFVYRSDEDIWGVPCAPQCQPEYVFHIYRSQ